MQDDQMDRHKQGKTFDGNELDTDCPNNANMGVEYASHCQEILDTLAKFQQIWDRRLGRIYMEQHRVEPTSQYLNPVKSATYRTRPQACEWEKK